MALVAFDIRRQTGAIDRRIYGNFIEHLGRCIYGGVFEPGSPLADAAGFRRDALEATRRLKVSNVRWPGGNFASGYHWLDGVGPAAQRPRRMELAWHTEESNQFGTDEFITWCREAGTEPYICVNMGSGTMDEARDWVEYCNGTGETHFAQLRRRCGHAEPYGVKLWGLGNEVSGAWQIGMKGAQEYATQALEFAKVMQWTDPSIQLVACGSCMQNASDMEFNEAVVRRLTDACDYLAIHMYVDNRADRFADYMGTTVAIERYLRAVRGIIDGNVYHTRDGKRLMIAFDEWNATYPYSHEHERAERYTLEDALVVGMFVNAFVRHADAVKLANMAQLVNVIAPIYTSPEGLFLQTIFYPLELHATRNGSVALDVHAEGESFRSDRYGEVPYVDCCATLEPADGTVCVHLINRSEDAVVPVEIECQHGSVAAQGVRYEIAGEHRRAMNDFATPDSVRTTQRELSVSGSTFTVDLAPCSATMLELRVTGG